MNKDLLNLGVLDIKAADLSKLLKTQTLGWQISSFNFPSIWSATKGKGIKVAVIDTAVDLNHPDIKIEGGWDFVKNAALSKISPKIGHGTHVCGIIGAKDNGLGIVGVAPECSLYNLAVLDENGSGSYANIIKALDWCIKNKMDIINMSLGGGGDSLEFYKAIRRVYDANIPMICAGGNGAWETGYLDFPGTYNETISVAAVNPNFSRATFSSIGPNIDIAAPGVDIVSCTPNNTYSSYSGTSMATPFVAGLVALLLAKHRIGGGTTPVDTVEHVREHLIKVAKDVDFKGQDNYTGYGIINPTGTIDFQYDPNLPSLLDTNYLSGKFKVRLKKQYSIKVNTPVSKTSKTLGKSGTSTVLLGKNGDIVELSITESELTNILKRIKGL